MHMATVKSPKVPKFNLTSYDVLLLRLLVAAHIPTLFQHADTAAEAVTAWISSPFS